MSGKELFLKLSQRDYSMSEQDIYAQFLTTLHYHLSISNQEPEFFLLLETAESLNKKIELKDSTIEEYFIDSLILS